MTVKDLRKRTGLSQSKFASKFHIHPMNISHWERGDRTPPEYVIYMMNAILDLEDELHKEKGKNYAN